MDEDILPSVAQLKQTQSQGVELPQQESDADALPSVKALRATQGRPEWSDDQYSRESRLRDIAKTHAEGGKSFEDARPHIEAAGIDPDKAKPTYRVEEEKAKLGGITELNPLTGQLRPTTGQAVGRVLPLIGSVQGWMQQRELGEARDRFQKGEATDRDYALIAQDEKREELAGKQSTGRGIMQGLGQVPAMAAEALAGGAAIRGGKTLLYGAEAVKAAETARAAQPLLGRALSNAGQQALATPLMPSMYLEQGARNLNEAKDRESFVQGVQSYGSAVATGVIQNAILGQLMGPGKPGEKLIGSVIKRTGAGIVEQQAADIVTSATTFSDGYGLAGDLAKAVKSDKYDDAFKHATLQVLTFAAFSALHGKTADGEKALKDFSDGLKAGAEAKVPPAEAARTAAESIVKEKEDTAKEEHRAASETADETYKDALRSGKSIDEAKEVASKAFEEKLGIKREPAKTVNESSGWKLHLATDHPEEVSALLKGLPHKVGHTSGQEGKDLTVYLGSREQTQKIADKINSIAGHLLKEPHGDTLSDDISFGGKVMGRFQARFDGKDPEFHQYGGNGIPWLKEDMDPFNRRPGAHERADKRLRERFGEFYTGPEPPKTAPPVAETPSRPPESHPESTKPAEAFPAAKKADLETLARKRRSGLKIEPEEMFEAYGLTEDEKATIRRFDKGSPEENLDVVDSALRKMGIDPHPEPPADELAKLSPKQRLAVEQRRAGVPLEKIGSSEKVSKQAIASREATAQKKLGRTETIEEENARERAEQQAAYKANSKLVDDVELSYRKESALPEPKRKTSQTDREDQWSKLSRAVEMVWEAHAKGGKIPPDIQERIDNVYDRITDGLDNVRPLTTSVRNAIKAEIKLLASQAPREAPADRGRTGKGVGDEQAPLLSATRPGIPEGNVAAPHAVADEGTRTAAQPAGARLAEAGRPDAEGTAAGTPAAPGGGQAPSGELTAKVDQSDLPSHNTPGAPVPGVTRGINASSPLTQAQVDAAVLSGATGEGGRVGLGAMAKGATPSSTPVPPAPPSKVPAGVAAVWNWLRDREGIIGGQIAPETSRLNAEAGNTIARLASTPDNQVRTVDYFTKQGQALLLKRAGEQVAAELAAGGSGLKPTKQQIQHTADYNADQYGSVNAERRLRMERAANMATERMELERRARSSDPDERSDALAKATAAKEAADAIGTMIGTKFHDEAAFQKVLHSDGYKEFMNWYGQKDGVHDKLEALYRKSQGMDPDADIQSRNQIERGVFQMKPIREGETLDDADRVYGGGGRKGNLLNPRVKLLGSAKAFKGTADAYDTNPWRVIEYSFANRMRNAAEAEVIRTLHANKTPDGKPLAYPALPGSDKLEGYQAFPTKRLPPEIRDLYPANTERNLWVHPNVQPELVRAYELSTMDHVLKGIEGNAVSRGIKKAIQLPTAINLVGIAEGTSHCIAQATIVLARGGIRSLPDMVRQIGRTMMGRPDAMKELMELSARGETKAQHAEWSLDEKGLLPWINPKYDPTKYVAQAQQATIGKFMDRFDSAMRLTMAHTFDRIAEAYPGVINSEQNKRDFINQLGNYQRTTQHWLVALARDLGIGPFATAATNNVAQSIRTMALGRGLRTADYATQVKLRAELGLQLAGVLGATALINYLIHKRVDGDDNTPLGGLKLPGNSGYVDMAALANLRRGSKTVGLQSLIEGQRYGGKGAESGQIGSNVLEGGMEAVVHPAAGPGINLARSAVYGKDVIGRPTVAKAKEHDMWAKLQAALLTENPMLEMIAKLSGVKTHPGKPEETPQTIERGLGLGSILKKSNRPPGKPLPTQ